MRAKRFRCTSCSRRQHADVNAAKNILAAGLAVTACREITPAGAVVTSKQEPAGNREELLLQPTYQVGIPRPSAVGGRQSCSLMTDPSDWLLTASERGNPDSDVPAWGDGNHAEALIDGATYFDRLVTEVEALGPGDHLFFADWRGDADQRLRDDGPTSWNCSARRPSAASSSRD